MYVNVPKEAGTLKTECRYVSRKLHPGSILSWSVTAMEVMGILHFGRSAHIYVV